MRLTHISDAVWKALAASYTTQQLLDLIFTVGQYNLVSMALNTLGVQLRAGNTSLFVTAAALLRPVGTV